MNDPNIKKRIVINKHKIVDQKDQIYLKTSKFFLPRCRKVGMGNIVDQ